MMLNSLLIGLRGQAAMQAEIIALRHQLTVFQRTQKPKRIMLKWHRPLPMGLAIAIVVWLAFRADHGQA
jgi:hypothetical protein